MGARTEAEARGVVMTQLRRQLSLAVHAGHMRVIHARCAYVGCPWAFPTRQRWRRPCVRARRRRRMLPCGRALSRLVSTGVAVAEGLTCSLGARETVCGLPFRLSHAACFLRLLCVALYALRPAFGFY